MHSLIGVVLCAATLFAQEPKPAAPKPISSKPVVAPEAPVKPARIGAVDFDGNGWPMVQDDPGTVRQPAAPVAEPRKPSDGPRESTGSSLPPSTSSLPPSVSSPSVGERTADVTPVDARSQGRSVPVLASGMEPGSPLLDVFQFVHAPGSWKSVGGVTVWWMVTVYGPQGEIVGYRELTQTSDCRYPDRDRIEYVNGSSSRIYGRSGATVFAERDGRPWLTATETAASELALFGLQVRMPWAFGDAGSYVVVQRSVVTRPDERLQRIVIERRPPAGLDVFGPEADPRPRDHFELLYEPGSGRPRELMHRFASSGETRRALFEDWGEFQSIPYPRRRSYVDENGRPTTTLEIRRIEPANVSERDFRML